MIDEQKLREMFWLWGMILPLGTESTQNSLEVMLGCKLADIVPAVMHSIAQMIINNPEEGTGHLIFVRDAINFALGESDEMPAVDMQQEKLTKLMQIQLGLDPQDIKFKKANQILGD